MNEGSLISYICRDSSLTLRFLHSHGYHISDCTSFLAVLLSSGLTACQYIIPLFTVLQGIPILCFPLFPTNLISYYFPKHMLVFWSDLISSLSMNKSGFFCFHNLIYTLCLEGSSHCLLSSFIYLSGFIFLTCLPFFFVFPKHLSESL